VTKDRNVQDRSERTLTGHAIIAIPTLTSRKFLVNPDIDIEPDYFLGRPTNRRFQRYIVYTKILSNFHARVEYFLLKNTPFNFKPMKIKKPQTSPSPWGTWTPSNTPIPRSTPLTTPNDSSIGSAVLPRYTFRTDQPTDRPTTDRQMRYKKPS